MVHNILSRIRLKKETESSLRNVALNKNETTDDVEKHNTYTNHRHKFSDRIPKRRPREVSEYMRCFPLGQALAEARREYFVRKVLLTWTSMGRGQ
jgi:hypothetical protein